MRHLIPIAATAWAGVLAVVLICITAIMALYALMVAGLLAQVVLRWLGILI